ncbi:MAG: phenylalanine--tRNA ligase subunit beta, partial [Thermoanaerobaculia bacterium]|nr:phenylalanine--tRNA ligase subunit beta [Thermoanaerobaculia bacterium]
GDVDVRQPRTPPPVLALELDKLCRFAGIQLAAAEVERIFEALGFTLEQRGEGRWHVTVPSWRIFDFVDPYPADLYEEVLRIHGLDAIPSTLPQISGSDAPEKPAHRLRRLAADHLAACGFSEAINFAFNDRSADAGYPSLYEGRPALALANPLSDRYAVMRRSLLPNLVASARYNQRRGATAMRLFELGHVFSDAGGGAPQEMDSLAIVLGGQIGTPWERSAELDFYDLKGVVESLGEMFGIAFQWRPATVRRLKSGAAAQISLADGTAVGYLGELDDDEGPLLVAELAVEHFRPKIHGSP